jgi:outer membrane protein OmpA-like peptidoglycan-associated protein
MVRFANGKFILTREGQDVTDALAKQLQGQTGYTLVVDGYTSAVGSSAFNEKLSRDRAMVVTEALEKAGVPSTAIQTNGKTAKDYAANRRVDVTIITMVP